MAYLLGIDVGTGGTKTVLFEDTGVVIQSAGAEYPLYQPQNGWAEQQPEDWWNAVVTTIQQVISVSGIDSDEIKGIGLSGQMHGLVMLDEHGRVLRPSIIWCDQRTAKECEEITARVGAERLIEITGNPALTGFTASKILWVRNNDPETYRKCRHILLPKDYIRYKLTGDFATEVSDASGMQLLDLKTRSWSGEILEKLEIPSEWLGRVYESPEITGVITGEIARRTGLAAGTPVVGGAGDNAAAAVGTGVVTEGKAFTTIGTSGVVYAHIDRMIVDPKGRVHTFCCAVPGGWHLMGVTQAAGLSLKWFRDNFCKEEMDLARQQNIDPYIIMTEEAERMPLGADNLYYLPYLMGERTPHLDPDCRGAFVGLSAFHTRSHLIRAVMEGVGYSLKDCQQILVEMGADVDDMTVTGGGGRSSLWRQMLADLYKCPVKTIVSQEGPALGAAILAAVGAGLYPSVQEACNVIIKRDQIQMPIKENSDRYLKNHPVFRQLYHQLRPGHPIGFSQ